MDIISCNELPLHSLLFYGNIYIFFSSQCSRFTHQVTHTAIAQTPHQRQAIISFSAFEFDLKVNLRSKFNLASSIIINDLIINANLTVIHTLQCCRARFSVSASSEQPVDRAPSDTEKKHLPVFRSQSYAYVVHSIVQYVHYLNIALFAVDTLGTASVHKAVCLYCPHLIKYRPNDSQWTNTSPLGINKDVFFCFFSPLYSKFSLIA